MSDRSGKTLAGVRGPRSNQLDNASSAMVLEGCTQSQLCKVFRMDRRTLADKLAEANVSPCGNRSGHAIYYIHEVAPYLVKPLYDVETYIKKMHHNDLPKHLTKEFWAGLKSKQDYELRAGMLWSTDDIFERVGEAFKTIRMSILLFRDAVERDTVMTDEQQRKITQMTDGLLNEMADRLQEVFGERHGEEEEDEEL
ncbi:putative terminase small subunit [Aeromonas phage BUCT552]|nr:putative terminase small subunit [Aeromonas phage BUCT552]